mmetsp:Transcript_110725/g.247065  ORF Transcript_110725/g.247065 Transcript_110725/m.247065 type:complete len:218 (-) Transcript_110725:259-912(-)
MNVERSSKPIGPLGSTRKSLGERAWIRTVPTIASPLAKLASLVSLGERNSHSAAASLLPNFVGSWTLAKVESAVRKSAGEKRCAPRYHPAIPPSVGAPRNFILYLPRELAGSSSQSTATPPNSEGSCTLANVDSPLRLSDPSDRFTPRYHPLMPLYLGMFCSLILKVPKVLPDSISHSPAAPLHFAGSCRLTKVESLFRMSDSKYRWDPRYQPVIWS